VDACTVTALDAITAFAVQNPNYSSQSRRFFQVWLSVGSPAVLITQLIRTGKVLFKPTLSSVDGSNLRDLLEDCPTPFFGAIGILRGIKLQKRKPLNCCRLMKGRLNPCLFIHRRTQQPLGRRGKQLTNIFMNQRSILTSRQRSRMVVVSYQ